MKNYFYTYEITNLTNGKKYIGQHCTTNLNDDYIGSCEPLIYDINVLKHKYKIDIIDFYSNIYELGDAEFKLQRDNNVKQNNLYYNNTVHRFYNKAFIFGINTKTRKKISDSVKLYYKNNKMTDETRKKISVETKKALSSPEVRKKISDRVKGENHPLFGKHHSEETKQKIRNTKLETEFTITDETRKKISDKLKGENHPYWNKHHNDETKAKISATLKGRKRTKESIEKGLLTKQKNKNI